MLQNQVFPDKFTYPFVLKACAHEAAHKVGEQMHATITKSPLKLDMFILCSLIEMYAKCGRMEYARSLFDEAKYKNVFCWNVLIDGYAKHGQIVAARQLFDQMPVRDLFTWNVMIDGYAKCGFVEDARILFDETEERDLVTWNSMIDGYARCGNMSAAKDLFDKMPMKDDVTWGTMIFGYAKFGRVREAHNWFEKLPYRNPVIWNSLIHGYANCKDLNSARKLFELMPCRNLTSWNAVLDAYVKGGKLATACKLFKKMAIRDAISWNTMIDGLARAGHIRHAQELFDAIPCRDLVSWNALLGGYKQNGQPKKVIELYTSLLSAGYRPDCSTLSLALSAVSATGLVDEGSRIHAYIERNKFPINGRVGVALIDMYSKCGCMNISMGIFDSIAHKTVYHWNAILHGAAIHGHGNLALSLFHKMEESGVVPDDITFLTILNACSHKGLVCEGFFYFELMRSKYSINPQIQHYGCMINLISRAGLLDSAMIIVQNMPFATNDIVWRSLLGASRNHGNAEVAEHAADRLLELMPHDSSMYVLLSNIYGCMGKSASAEDVWKAMKKRRVVKIPGRSSIEVNESIC